MSDEDVFTCPYCGHETTSEGYCGYCMEDFEKEDYDDNSDFEYEGFGPACIEMGCKHWGGDDICMIAIINHAKDAPLTEMIRDRRNPIGWIRAFFGRLGLKLEWRHLVKSGEAFCPLSID